MTGACFSIFPQVPWASQETCSNIQAKIQIVSLTLVWSINLLSCKLANDLPLLVPFQVGFGVLGGILVWFVFCFFLLGGGGGVRGRFSSAIIKFLYVFLSFCDLLFYPSTFHDWIVIMHSH